MTFERLATAPLKPVKVSSGHAPGNNLGLAWDDPALGIPWPLGEEPPIVSGRDQEHGALAALPPCFTYSG